MLLFNPNAQLREFDAEGKKSFLIALDCGKGVKNYRLPIWLRELLFLFDGKSDLNAIRKSYEAISGKPEWKKFEKLIFEFFIPKGLIIDTSKRSSAGGIATKKSAMLLSFRLVSKTGVNLVSKYLSFFFNPVICSLLLASAIASQSYYLISLESSAFTIESLSSNDLILSIALVAAGLFFHEFGHSSAAYKYQCRNMEIGVGWYVCFLVFYADLSESWKLERNKRLIVDVGGMYFQLIYTSALIWLCFLYNNSALFYSISLLNIAFLWNLNPFFRMDGYWIASDYIGVANLRDVSKQMALNWLRNRKLDFKTPELSRKTALVVLLYSLSSTAFVFLFTYLIVERLFEDVYPILHENFFMLKAGNWMISDIIVYTFSSLWQLIFVIFACWFLFSVCKKTYSLKKLFLKKDTTKV